MATRQRRELVRVAALAGYQQVAASLGLDTRPLLKAAGLTAILLSEPEQLLPARPVIELLEDSAARSACPVFGVRMALERTISDMGLISVLIALQPNLAQALQMMSKHRNNAVPIIALHVERHRGLAVIGADLNLAANRPFRQTNELLLGAIVIIARTMLGRDWAPICTYVAYPEPAPCDRAFYRRAFGNQLQFNADFNGMAVVPEDLDRSRENHDPGLAHHAERLIDRLAEPGDPDFLPAVQQALGYLLGSSRGTMAEVAASLNLHPRTLQRRLQREGVRFRELVHETRVRLAARFVANPNLRIAEIAEALGYSSTGAFSRWFRHEFGRPPTQYR